ncbi:MAG: peptide ABC transporter substrate-binding protein [Dehalococcoidia bacterium]|nr:peptide ABC transporter substrate-binding protein [Dehalococcoidia bacterium]
MKKSLILLVALIVSMVAVACSGDKTNTSGSTSTPSSKTTPTPNATIKPSSGKLAGVLRRTGDEPLTLDPALATDTSSAHYIVEIFGGLVKIGHDLRVTPELAESWTVSPDGKVYTFKIRKNAKFNDGRAVTAKDFKYTLERAADPATAAPVAEQYLGDIIGVNDKLLGNAKEVSGVKIIDDQTLQITIDASKAYFIAQMTYTITYVVDRANVESGGKTWALKPNGTGPFYLAKYTQGDSIVLKKNPNYWGTVSLDEIRYNLAGGDQMAQYQNGEIDVAGVGVNDLARVQNPKEPLNKELVKPDSLFDVSYIGFDVTKAPFDDVKVRQAFNHAIDKPTITKDVLANLSSPAFGILPPGFPGYSPDMKVLIYDPVKAKELIKQSKYGDVSKFPRIALTISGTGGDVGPVIEAFIQNWKDNLGVTVDIQQVESATFFQALQTNKRTHRMQMYALGWSADYPDPYDYLDILLYSKSANNYGSYSSPQVDQLLLQARAEQDVPKRVGLYNQAEQMIITDAAWLPLFYGGERYVLVKPYIKNYKLPPMVIERFKDVVVEAH